MPSSFISACPVLSPLELNAFLRLVLLLALGIGGTCSIYDPPFSFFCGSEFSSGCGGCFTYSIPGGLKVGDNIKKKYTRWQDGYIVAWREAHWSNWAFDFKSYDPATQTFVFDKGGFQGSRGGIGAEYFLLNIFDELDQPTEYFFDNTTQLLYYFPNNTQQGQPPSPETDFVAIVQHTLLNVTGASPASPVRNLVVRGLGFRDTAWTMMEPHAVPSGGDWGLERMGALYFESTEDLLVRHGSGHCWTEGCGRRWMALIAGVNGNGSGSEAWRLG